jgi:hypothetical protein
LNNNQRSNNRLYQQQLQEVRRNKSRCDCNLEEDRGLYGQPAKEQQGGDYDGEEKLYLRRAMDGRRSGHRRWASTIEGGGAGFETWSAAERPSPAVKGGIRLGLVESNSNETRSDTCCV